MPGRVVALLTHRDVGKTYSIHPQRCPVVQDAVDPRSWGLRCVHYDPLIGLRTCPFLVAAAQSNTIERCKAEDLVEDALDQHRSQLDCSVICLLANPRSTAAGV